MVFEKLKAAARDPRPLAEAVGLYLVGASQRAFSDQKRGGAGWAPRGVPNRAGILADLQAGRTPPSRRWEPRPAGMDTGRLRQSIAFRTAGASVTVGSNLPYASDVQRGATKTITIDGDLRKRLLDWLRTLSGDQRVRAEVSFASVLRSGSMTITTPPRPFIMVTPEDKRRITEMARSYFLGVIGGK